LGISLRDEWILAAAICAVPFLIFGTMELAAWLRRRRLDAIARRSKAIPRDRSGRALGPAD
jgi:hypothetical protein